MRFKFLRWIVAVVFVATLLWSVLFFLLFPNSKNWSNFKMFTANSVQDPKVLLAAYFYKFGNVPKSLPKSVSGTENEENYFNKLDAGNTWNWKESYVVARVLGMNSEDKVLSVQIILPKNKFFSDIPKYVRVECPLDEIRIALRENQVVTDRRVDLFSTVAENDLVLAYCPDDKCNSFTKACALIKMNSE
jgi:hypothetical protein